MPKQLIKIATDIREAIAPNKAGKGEYNFHIVQNLIQLSKKNPKTELILFNDNRFTPPKEWQKYTINIPHQGLKWHKEVAKSCHKQGISNYFSPTSYITPHYIHRFSSDTKTLTTVHDLIVFLHPQSHPLKPRLIENYYLKKLTKLTNNTFTTVSDSTKKDLQKIFPRLASDQIKVIKNGLKDFPKPSTKTSKKAKPFILSVSTILPRKNYITLLKAFNIIKSLIPHEIHIIGKYDKKNLAPLLKYIKDHQLEKRVKILGYVSSKKLSSEYANADMLVIPSTYEGFGLPVIEGLKRGLPVICSDIPVFHEVADPAALFFKPLNPVDLANQIIFLHKNQEQKQILSKEGPKLVKKYNWKKSSQKIWKILLK